MEQQIFLALYQNQNYQNNNVINNYKTIYEHERKVGNEFINNLQDAFNNQMDVIISSIDNHIKKLI